MIWLKDAAAGAGVMLFLTVSYLLIGAAQAVTAV